MALFRSRAEMRQYRAFEECFLLIKKISASNTSEETDLAAGYVLGVVDEKFIHTAITKGQKATLIELVEAVHKDRKKQFEGCVTDLI